MHNPIHSHAYKSTHTLECRDKARDEYHWIGYDIRVVKHLNYLGKCY